ncbi:MAG: branched-chain amino acid ABC transporter permease [Christensenellales bacterium]|jgi:branched-chain amino acid transport system permease protein
MNKGNSVFQFIKKHPIMLIFLALCLIVPAVLRNEYLLRVFCEMFFYAALGSAWNILGGFGRQTSWCSASFFAMGAYTTMLFFINGGGVSPWLTIWLGMAIAGVLAVIIGLPCFRLRGVFFSIATISFASIVRQILFYFNDFTGGAQGLKFQIRTENSFINLSFLNETSWYYVAMALMLVTVAVTAIINRSKMGYYLKAIREDEDAAESLGIRAHRLKLIAFIISAMLIAAIGTFYGFKMSYIDPNSVASHDLSIRIGVTAIIGGMGTIWGPVLGAFVAIPMLEIANYYLSTVGGGGAGFALYGLAMILIVLLRPNGLISLFDGLKDRIIAKRISREGQVSNE